MEDFSQLSRRTRCWVVAIQGHFVKPLRKQAIGTARLNKMFRELIPIGILTYPVFHGCAAIRLIGWRLVEQTTLSKLTRSCS